MPDEPIGLSVGSRSFLLALARRTITAAAAGWTTEIDSAEAPVETHVVRACFVTLSKRGELRGCIGHLKTDRVLWQNVMQAAEGAARRDPRFEAVRAEEVEDLAIEINVLAQPELILESAPDAILAQIQPGRHGVWIECEGRYSTYLPTVWERCPDKTAFMQALSRKAGLGAEGWKTPGCRVSVYETDCFAEPGFRLG
jgi:AmmeMemoRadiSam system protein A